MSGFGREGEDEFARGARALIVYPDLGGRGNNMAPEARLEEARGLALAIGLHVVDALYYRVRSPRAVTLLGSGQVTEITGIVTDGKIEVLIVDNNLTAIQQRNLEDKIGVKVIDRTGLILEIFGERAVSAEGRLQVELAHLDYQAGRLVRSWTHLERQRGGFGFLGGPGETQIEADRRMIRDRMAKLRRDLEYVKRTRALHRARRRRAPWPTIALVGYTNAGKSTLFNRLTKSDVVAEDMLFATLDPTMRHISVPGVEKAILSDTVGFVSDLPTQLVAAFRATLEEVTTADIIVHVRDIAHPASDAQRDDVLSIMSDLGINGEGGEPTPIIELWNKADLLNEEQRELLAGKARRNKEVLLVSAQNGDGVSDFLNLLNQHISSGNEVRGLILRGDEGAALAWLHNKGRVKTLSDKDGVINITASLNKQNWGQFEKLFGAHS